MFLRSFVLYEKNFSPTKERRTVALNLEETRSFAERRSFVKVNNLLAALCTFREYSFRYERDGGGRGNPVFWRGSNIYNAQMRLSCHDVCKEREREREKSGFAVHNEGVAFQGATLRLPTLCALYINTFFPEMLYWARMSSHVSRRIIKTHCRSIVTTRRFLHLIMKRISAVLWHSESFVMTIPVNRPLDIVWPGNKAENY